MSREDLVTKTTSKLSFDPFATAPCVTVKVDDGINQYGDIMTLGDVEALTDKVTLQLVAEVMIEGIMKAREKERTRFEGVTFDEPS
jgi:hypothetical protein